MATEQKSQDYRIDQFHSGPGARADHWHFLVDAVIMYIGYDLVDWRVL